MLISAIFNLSSPGSYLNWHFISISVANFALIIAMLIIFGLALLIPFPDHKTSLKFEDPYDESVDVNNSDEGEADAEDKKLLTFKMRKAIRSNLPLDKLVPDRQPAYVESWVYVFGVATLVALSLVIASVIMLVL
jgi:hypothetical protein